MLKAGLAPGRVPSCLIPGMPHLAQLRGHNGEELFRHEEDYSAFERCMQDAAQRYAVSIHPRFSA
jgi:hypothetical protein